MSTTDATFIIPTYCPEPRRSCLYNCTYSHSTMSEGGGVKCLLQLGRWRRHFTLGPRLARGPKFPRFLSPQPFHHAEDG